MINTREAENKTKLVLDTHILLWYLEGIELTESQVNLIEKVRESGNLYISAISVWEITMLVSKGRVALSVPLTEWINTMLSIAGLNVIDLSITILMESCLLPSYEHKDPADRLIIASVRNINGSLLTFDQKIIEYGNKGYIKIINLDAHQSNNIANISLE